MRNNFKDLTGEKINDWLVVSLAEPRKERTYWLCRCVCGAEREVNASSLKRGISTSCGCSNRLKIIGQKFDKLTAVEHLKQDSFGASIYRFKCDCGNELETKASPVKLGKVKSCGCSHITNDMSRTKTYHAWQRMKQRCYDKNSPDYENYGGRGNKICDSWLESFENF